jgi:hypothetical protein
MPIQNRPDMAQPIAALVGLLALLAIHIVLARQAVADLGRDDRRVRVFSKQAWFVVITLAAIIGPVAYFSFGREEGP